MLLLPGFGASHSAWSFLVPALKREFSLVLVDLPGVGNGPPLRTEQGPEQLAEPLVGLLDHLEIDRIHVLGASLGGWVGMWLAWRSPDRISRLVLAGSMARLEEGARARFQKRVEEMGPSTGGFARSMVQDMLAPAFVDMHPKLVDAVVLAYSISLPSPSSLGVLAGLIAGADLSSHLHEIHSPVLLLHGDQDDLVSPESAKGLAEALPSAVLKRFEGAGHHVLLERRVEALKEIRAFFQQ